MLYLTARQNASCKSNMFETTFFSILILVAFAIPGFIGRKIGKVRDVGSLVFLLSYVAQPFLVISSIQSVSLSAENTSMLGVSALIALVAHAVIIGICLLVFAKDKHPGAKAYALAGSFGNYGFMGIPLMQNLISAGLLAQNALICTTAIIVVFNLLTWTIGSFVLTGEKRYISVKNCLLNPPTLIALFVALPLYFLNVVLPPWAMKGVDLLGNLSAPVSLFILGVRLADMTPKSLLTDVRTYISSALKLIIAPLATFLVMLPFRAMIGETVFKVMYISMAMPSASMILMLSELFNVEGAPAPASRVQCVSTLLSVVTVPVMMMLI